MESGKTISNMASDVKSGIMVLRPMRESSLMGKRMVKVGSSGVTGHITRANSLTASFTGKVSIISKRVKRPTLGNLWRAASRARESPSGPMAESIRVITKTEKRMERGNLSLQTETFT